MPSPVVELRQAPISSAIFAVDGEFGLARTVVDAQLGVARFHLQHEEVAMLSGLEFAHGSVVHDQSVLTCCNEFDARVTVLALNQWLEPRPAVSVEAVMGLLAPRAGKASVTITSEEIVYSLNKQFHMTMILGPIFYLKI